MNKYDKEDTYSKSDLIFGCVLGVLMALFLLVGFIYLCIIISDLLNG